MKSDLRNMVTAQESYWVDAKTYYNGPIPGPAMAYGPSQDVTITVSNVTNAGWSASATSTATPRSLRHLHRHGCRARAGYSAWRRRLYPVARG